eukprot:CAMPEP_0171164148 /NCGR_PEP_ID=MMETSP0790-20130122/5519_1 /TAXON_ID=2925 /ORGANISM="Alexandrium catenella, Strain OF101" /LENGTH=360 /DNA_ID=CAMNT_0011628895 /DNA_START=390 /DNA_END=1469 /DNA_ORIENTATION=+
MINTHGSKLERRVLFSSAAFWAANDQIPLWSSLIARKMLPMRCLSAAMVTPTLAKLPKSARACAMARQSKLPTMTRSCTSVGTAAVASPAQLVLPSHLAGVPGRARAGEEEDAGPATSPLKLPEDGLQYALEAAALLPPRQLVDEGAGANGVEDHRDEAPMSCLQHHVHGEANLHGHVVLVLLQRATHGHPERDAGGRAGRVVADLAAGKCVQTNWKGCSPCPLAPSASGGCGGQSSAVDCNAMVPSIVKADVLGNTASQFWGSSSHLHSFAAAVVPKIDGAHITPLDPALRQILHRPAHGSHEARCAALAIPGAGGHEGAVRRNTVSKLLERAAVEEPARIRSGVPATPRLRPRGTALC